LKYSTDDALRLAKDLYFDTYYRNGSKKGYITFDEIKVDVLYQTVFMLTNDDTISFAGITAYDKKNNLYMTSMT
jgi:hypothetical protein